LNCPLISSFFAIKKVLTRPGERFHAQPTNQPTNHNPGALFYLIVGASLRRPDKLEENLSGQAQIGMEALNS
jgi:hypothetical protein